MFHYIHLIELLTFLIAIIFYRHIKSSYMKWFLPFLGFIFFSELYASYLAKIVQESVIGINFLIAIVESFFYGYIFYNLIESNAYKKWVKLLVLFSVTFYVIFYLYNQSTLKYFVIVINLFGLGITFFAISFLYNSFKNDNDNVVFIQPGFWISFGVCIFYSGSSITFSFIEYFKQNNILLFGEPIINVVMRSLSLILYFSLSISIILCKRQTKVSY